MRYGLLLVYSRGMAEVTEKDPFGPVRIGSLKLKNNLVAAPMAGLSSLPYRMLALEQGCALAVSEMVSAEGALRAHERTRRYFANDNAARPFGVQLFGANPESIRLAVEMLEAEPVDLIDINMGCPVKKVCCKGAGAALMCTPGLVGKIVSAARRATARPLTVKIRSGWDEENINCAEIARIAEGAGADAVAIHGRTKRQEFRGKADLRSISQVKCAVSIPVIGNGDVKCREDALRMLSETGCDGVMIGRAAVGNPWIFRSILTGDAPPGPVERGEAAARHMDHLREVVGDKIAVLNMRAVLPWYGKGIPGVKAFLQGVHRTSSPEELKENILEFFSNAGRVNEAPA